MCQFGEADPTEELTTARTCHEVTSAVLLQNRTQQISITKEKSSLLDVIKNLLRYTYASEFCYSNRSENNYLYFCEAVWTELGVDCHPALIQEPVQSCSHYWAAISALQEAFPLFTATNVVFPQSCQPLWQTHKRSVLNKSHCLLWKKWPLIRKIIDNKVWQAHEEIHFF